MVDDILREVREREEMGFLEIVDECADIACELRNIEEKYVVDESY